MTTFGMQYVDGFSEIFDRLNRSIQTDGQSILIPLNFLLDFGISSLDRVSVSDESLRVIITHTEPL
ncbi:hypothetical protein D3C71_1797410 [compost metagenome]